MTGVGFTSHTTPDARKKAMPSGMAFCDRGEKALESVCGRLLLEQLIDHPLRQFQQVR